MKKKNAGFSLVELIVVMAIMAIFAGVSFYGISTLPKYRARECASKIASNLSEVKVITLGKAKKNGDIVWELYKEDSKFYVKYLTEAASTPNSHADTKISKGRISVFLADKDGIETELGEGESLKLVFNRATGALYGCSASGAAITTQKSPKGAPYTFEASKGYTPVKKIIVRGGSWEYVVEIAPATGKISN